MLTNEIPVLKKGFVRLEDHMGNDLSIVRAARISTGTDYRGEDKDNKLIHRLMRDGHTSPFESVVFTFHVKAPIFTVRQWMRHRTWSYSEYSLRYSEAEQDFYVPDAEVVHYQHKVNKQGRDKTKSPTYDVQTHVANEIDMANKEAWARYKELIELDISREIARMVLPVTYFTQFYGTINLHNLFKFMELRSASDAQWEIQQYSKAIEEIVKSVCPVAFAAWEAR